jgi:hypothetical protein
MDGKHFPFFAAAQNREGTDPLARCVRRNSRAIPSPEACLYSAALRQPRAPIDNNIVERALNTAILNRKNHFSIRR